MVYTLHICKKQWLQFVDGEEINEDWSEWVVWRWAKEECECEREVCVRTHRSVQVICDEHVWVSLMDDKKAFERGSVRRGGRGGRGEEWAE